MFRLFGASRKKKNLQMQQVNFHLQLCQLEIEKYIQERPNPTGEDLVTVAINAKILYEIFRNINEVKESLRQFISSHVTNGAAAIATLQDVDISEAAMLMKLIIEQEFESLQNNQSNRVFINIKQAYAISRVLGFDE